jgi:hypothetical protein
MKLNAFVGGYLKRRMKRNQYIGIQSAAAILMNAQDYLRSGHGQYGSGTIVVLSLEDSSAHRILSDAVETLIAENALVGTA